MRFSRVCYLLCLVAFLTLFVISTTRSECLLGQCAGDCNDTLGWCSAKSTDDCHTCGAYNCGCIQTYYMKDPAKPPKSCECLVCY